MCALTDNKYDKAHTDEFLYGIFVMSIQNFLKRKKHRLMRCFSYVVDLLFDW